ncbi:MAG: CPBP family intramembrane metalloprotease [Arenicella sp.]|jgi:membrane protease YdiL (CAAX protease family)|nr:CPBP family intramembrane metalloprotease [Arenicella sp.]
MAQLENKPLASIRPLIIFLLLTIVFYCVGYWLIFRLERASPLMMSVGLAAVVTCFLFKRPLSSLGLKWGDNRYQWISFLVPLAIAMLSYLIIWGLGFAEFNSSFADTAREDYNLPGWSDTSIIAFHVLLTATFSLLLSIPSVFGEEIAWRGFVVGELSKLMSFGRVALISGVLWSAFHWPLIIKGFYGSGYTPLIFQISLFTLFIMSNSVIMTYLRYKTDSVWTAVLYHASSNIFVQKVFTPMTVVDQNSAWYVDEFGVVIPVVALLAALYFWRLAEKEAM